MSTSLNRYIKEKKDKELNKKLTEVLMLEAYQKDPLFWLEDRFREDPKNYKWSDMEGYENHVWDGSKDPLYNAWMALAKGRWVGIEAATGTSKTFFLSRLVYWFLDCFEDSLVVTTAPKRDQLSLHLWAEMTKVFHKFKRIRPHADMLTLKMRVDKRRISQEEEEDEETDLSQSWQAVGFVAGVGTEEQSATKAQGFHRQNMLIIVEETPGVSPAVIEAFENTSTGSKNFIICVGNPDHENDALHQFCEAQYVKNYTVSAFDYPNIVRQADIFPGAVTQVSIDRRRDKYGEDSAMYQSRVRGRVPQDDDNALIKMSWVEACWLQSDKCKAVEVHGEDAIGIDVANSETGDKASVIHGSGNVVKGIREFQCPNAAAIAHNIMLPDYEVKEKGYPYYNLPKYADFGYEGHYIGVDAVGVGVSTINAFLEPQYGLTVISIQGGEWSEVIPVDAQDKPLYKFSNLRSQIYWELREDIRVAALVLDIKNIDTYKMLRRELMATRFVLTGGAIAIESKEQIKKRLGGLSPNNADALAYWNWVRKGYRVVEQKPWVAPSGGGKS